MKLSWMLIIGSLSFFTAGLAVADDDDRRKHRAKTHYSDKHYRAHNHRYRDYRHEKRYRKHHHRKHRHNSDYFWGGVVVGSLASHAFHDYCPDRRYHKRHKKRYRSSYYWANSYGECFRVERRKHRDVYIEVPRRKCY